MGKKKHRIERNQCDEKKVNTTENNPLPYRSIFIPKCFDKTLEQLWTTQEDQSYNHRNKAVKKFTEWQPINKRYFSNNPKMPLTIYIFS